MLRTIQFQGHWGKQDPVTNACHFYNVCFTSICVASEHLKNIPAGPQYEGRFENGVLYFEVREFQYNEYIMEVQRLHERAHVPRRISEGSAGYNLYSSESCSIRPGERYLVPLGISISMPPGLYGRLAPRSELSINDGIQVGAGVIDSDYHGEIKVLLFNHHPLKVFTILQGDKIAQLILERNETPCIVEVEKLSRVTL